MGALKMRRCKARRPRALAGQRKGSLLGLWPTFSPRTLFFWSENSSDANVMFSKSVSSFKGHAGSEAFHTRSWMVNWMLRKVKASLCEPASGALRYSAGRRSQ